MDPILVLLAPLWLLAPTPLTLAVVQIGACALGALPVFWLGRRHLESEMAGALLALAYLAYPWLAWTALDAMHPVTLAIPLFLFAIWFLDGNRLIPFAICAVLIAATGELMGLPIAFLGLWYWLAHGHRRDGLTIATAGFLWTVLCIKITVPAFRGSESQFYGFFEPIGGSPEGVVRTLVTDPVAILDALATRSDVLYLLALALPLAGVFLLAPSLTMIAIPQLSANMLSSFNATTDPRAHYIAAVLPFLVAAGIVGVARLAVTKRVPAATAILALGIGFSAALGPWPGSPGEGRGLNPWVYGTPRPSHFDALSDALAIIPDDVPVASTNKAGSRLSARRFIFSVPIVERADWILIDSLDPWVPLKPPRQTRRRWGRSDPRILEAFTRRIAESRDWISVFEREGVLVFRKADTPYTRPRHVRP